MNRIFSVRVWSLRHFQLTITELSFFPIESSFHPVSFSFSSWLASFFLSFAHWCWKICFSSSIEHVFSFAFLFLSSRRTSESQSFIFLFFKAQVRKTWWFQWRRSTGGKRRMAQLQVTVVQAKNLKKKDLFSENDPFVEIYLDDKNQKQKTTVKRNTKTPHWNETFLL